MGLHGSDPMLFFQHVLHKSYSPCAPVLILYSPPLPSPPICSYILWRSQDGAVAGMVAYSCTERASYGNHWCYCTRGGGHVVRREEDWRLRVRNECSRCVRKVDGCLRRNVGHIVDGTTRIRMGWGGWGHWVQGKGKRKKEQCTCCCTLWIAAILGPLTIHTAQPFVLQFTTLTLLHCTDQKKKIKKSI